MKCTLPNDFEELLSFHMIQWLTFQQALGTYPTAAYLSFGAPNYGSGPNGWQVLWVDCAAYQDTVHALHHVCSTKYFQGAKMCDFRVSYLFSLWYYWKTFGIVGLFVAKTPTLIAWLSISVEDCIFFPADHGTSRLRECPCRNLITRSQTSRGPGDCFWIFFFGSTDLPQTLCKHYSLYNILYICFWSM